MQKNLDGSKFDREFESVSGNLYVQTGAGTGSDTSGNPDDLFPTLFFGTGSGRDGRKKNLKKDTDPAPAP